MRQNASLSGGSTSSPWLPFHASSHFHRLPRWNLVLFSSLPMSSIVSSRDALSGPTRPHVLYPAFGNTARFQATSPTHAGRISPCEGALGKWLSVASRQPARTTTASLSPFRCTFPLVCNAIPSVVSSQPLELARYAGARQMDMVLVQADFPAGASTTPIATSTLTCNRRAL